jgi:hypothetical protein
MAYYLVTASLDRARQAELKTRLDAGEINVLRPFGQALDYGLRHARRLDDGRIIWEEEDYCRPPLAMERAAVLDHYFSGIAVETVQPGEGWRRIEALPRLWQEDGGGT